MNISDVGIWFLFGWALNDVDELDDSNLWQELLKSDMCFYHQGKGRKVRGREACWRISLVNDGRLFLMCSFSTMVFEHVVEISWNLWAVSMIKLMLKCRSVIASNWAISVWCCCNMRSFFTANSFFLESLGIPLLMFTCLSSELAH